MERRRRMGRRREGERARARARGRLRQGHTNRGQIEGGRETISKRDRATETKGKPEMLSLIQI